MVGCTRHQAAEAGGLSSEYERLFWLRIGIHEGEPARLILIIFAYCIKSFISSITAIADARPTNSKFYWIHYLPTNCCGVRYSVLYRSYLL